MSVRKLLDRVTSDVEVRYRVEVEWRLGERQCREIGQ